MKLPQPPLLVITDRKQAQAALEDMLAASFAAGCRWASVREKDLPADEQVALARHLRTVADHWDARLTLHGDPALAQAAEIDGVHLAAGGNAAAARALLGAEALVGMSVHTVEGARRLDPGVVDYAIAGPAYASASKPGYGPVLGASGLGAICRASAVPIVAIGGITPATIPEVLATGAAGIAVMGGMMRAADARREAEHLIAAMRPAAASAPARYPRAR